MSHMVPVSCVPGVLARGLVVFLDEDGGMSHLVCDRRRRALTTRVGARGDRGRIWGEAPLGLDPDIHAHTTSQPIPAPGWRTRRALRGWRSR